MINSNNDPKSPFYLRPQYEIVRWLTRLFTMQQGYSSPSKIEVARWTGLSKTTLREAVETGRMSRVTQVRLSIYINRFGQVKCLPEHRIKLMDNRNNGCTLEERNELAQAIRRLSRAESDKVGINVQIKRKCDRGKIPNFHKKTYERLKGIIAN